MFITTSLPKAKEFLDMMIRGLDLLDPELCRFVHQILTGHPEYGCFISKEKTLTNFDYDAQIMNVTGPRDTRESGRVACNFAFMVQQTSLGVAYG